MLKKQNPPTVTCWKNKGSGEREGFFSFSLWHRCTITCGGLALQAGTWLSCATTLIIFCFRWSIVCRECWEIQHGHLFLCCSQQVTNGRGDNMTNLSGLLFNVNYMSIKIAFAVLATGCTISAAIVAQTGLTGTLSCFITSVWHSWRDEPEVMGRVVRLLTLIENAACFHGVMVVWRKSADLLRFRHRSTSSGGIR